MQLPQRLLSRGLRFGVAQWFLDCRRLQSFCLFTSSVPLTHKKTNFPRKVDVEIRLSAQMTFHQILSESSLA